MQGHGRAASVDALFYGFVVPADFSDALGELFVALGKGEKGTAALCVGDALRDLAD
jgi:hypothetical protein